MTPTTDLRLGTLPLTAEIIETGSYTSLHTGISLRRWRLQFSISKEGESLIEDFMRTKQPVATGPENGPSLWRIGESSMRFSSDSPSFTTFTWEVFELEQLKIDRLVMDGWELSPYEHKEEFDPAGVLTISARVELSDAEEEKLRSFPIYFKVVRTGINNTPREMRFGQLLWSRSNDKYRMQIFLVDKAYDDQVPRFSLGEPQTTNVATSAARSAMLVSRLLDLLVRKGALSSTEAEQVRNVSKKELDRELSKRDKVTDLDEWLRREGN